MPVSYHTARHGASVSPSIPPSIRKPKAFQEWQRVRRLLGSKYHEQRIQRLMIEDAQRLGDQFIKACTYFMESTE